MLSSRANSDKSTVNFSHKILSFLAVNLPKLEEDILVKFKENKKSILSNMGARYQLALELTASNLTKLSSLIFCNVSIDSVKIYNSEANMPEDYRLYCNAQKNLSALIQHDILTQPNLKYAAMHAERWIYISKLCYEKCDYFSAGSIVYGLISATIDSKHLEDRLSLFAKAVLSYYKDIFQRQAKLHTLQERQYHNRSIVIPMLSTLANQLANIEEYMSNDPKSELADQLNACKNLYKDMRRTNSRASKSVNHVIQGVLESLQADIGLDMNADVKNAKIYHTKKLRVNFNKLIEKISIYDQDDMFYRSVYEMPFLRIEFSRLDSSKLNEYNKGIFSNIVALLKQSDINDESRLKQINNLINDEQIDRRILKGCDGIVNALNTLAALEFKRLSLEPKVIKQDVTLLRNSRLHIDSDKERKLKSLPHTGRSSPRRRTSTLEDGASTPTKSNSNPINHHGKSKEKIGNVRLVGNSVADAEAVERHRSEKILSASVHHKSRSSKRSSVALTKRVNSVRSLPLFFNSVDIPQSNNDQLNTDDMGRMVSIDANVPDLIPCGFTSTLYEMHENIAAITVTTTTTTTIAKAMASTADTSSTVTTTAGIEYAFDAECSTAEAVNTSDSSSSGKKHKSKFTLQVPRNDFFAKSARNTNAEVSRDVAALISSRRDEVMNEDQQQVMRSQSAPAKSQLPGLSPRYNTRVSQMVRNIEQSQAMQRRAEIYGRSAQSAPDIIRQLDSGLTFKKN